MSGGRSVVTVGTYDGVHLGHQSLIREAKAEAARLGLRSVVVTFDRHPVVTIRPGSAPLLITDLDLKLELIAATGVDEVVVLEFDLDRTGAETPEAFAEDLVSDLEATVVLVGENFRFGHDHRGDVSLLEHLGKELGFSARGIRLVTDDASQVVVSSRKIRELIAEGSLADVERLLGRPFELRGLWTSGPDGGILTPGSDLARPPAGEYKVMIREPGEHASKSVVTGAVAEDGSVSLPLDGVALSIGDGELVGLVFSDNA